MLNLDPAKLAVISIIAIVVIGPERLPGLARQAGTAWRTVTSLRDQAESEVRRAIPELPHLPSSPASSISSFLTTLTSTEAKAAPATDEAGATPTALNSVDQVPIPVRTGRSGGPLPADVATSDGPEMN